VLPTAVSATGIGPELQSVSAWRTSVREPLIGAGDGGPLPIKMGNRLP
jgi:hypothetical protein